ncbi:unnamed protein product [Effrenium voratum]|uniref:RING-type domain-containing protein n=1 Tax=Effrenium voratum TaxID=2562239 RepID=A0AA36HYW3_9DINO|nr:unnamed protein product [Effrenium voratum]CAJ1423814.1 unnamed protein product [Effrenium voratum]
MSGHEPTDAEGLILFEASNDGNEETQGDTTQPDAENVQAPVLHWACAMCMFATLLCLMTIASICLLVWLAYEYTKYSADSCDVPLQFWVQVVSLTALFNLACNQQDRYGTLGARIFCGWRFDPENPERMPVRVQAYNLLVPIFTAVWNCVGLYWVSQAKEPALQDRGLNGTAVEEPEVRPCKEVAPGLLAAIRAYASFNLLYSLFILIGVAGLSQILYCLARRGLIRVSDAAPPGSLERNTEEVTLEDPATLEQTSCSICLEDFAHSEGVLVKTKQCGHVFHKAHLQNWLMVHRTCPLCRSDLGISDR